MSSPSPFLVLRGHTCSVNAVQFLYTSPSISTRVGLLSGDEQSEVKVWDLQIRRPIHCWNSRQSNITTVAQISQEYLVTAGRDGTVKIWSIQETAQSNAREKSPIETLVTGCEHFCNISVNTNQEGNHPLILTADPYARALLWDWRNSHTIQQQFLRPEGERSAGMLTSISWFNENIFFAGYEDGSIASFDLRMNNDRMLDVLKVHQQPVFAIAPHPTKAELFTAGGDEVISKLDITTCKTDMMHPAHNNENPSSSEFKYETVHRISLKQTSLFLSMSSRRSDGRILISGHWDHTIRLYQCKQCKPLAILKHHTGSVFSIDTCSVPISSSSDDGSSLNGFFASGSKDSTIAIWNVLHETYSAQSKS